MNIVYIVLFISIAFNLLMFFYFRWYIKKRTSASRLLPEERTELSRHIAEANAVIVDINAVTDRNILLVEDKIKQLKEILNDTVYVKDYEKIRAGDTLYTNLGRGIRAALKTEGESAPPAVGGADRTLNVSQRAPALSAVHAKSDIKPQAPPEIKSVPMQFELQQVKQKPPSKKQIRASIDQLLDEGISPEEVASRLEISIAEVDFAVNLRRKN